ncbi:ubiquitin carboxyl-terminal hydrolase [Phlyctema vagabunda]|uniref:Ubiquitin carboxyl-terminal hydrolase n=1 Tax=Phlyctema vagabunda TaxID=108571 RepID=A0ABR4PWF4_9HELO
MATKTTGYKRRDSVPPFHLSSSSRFSKKYIVGLTKGRSQNPSSHIKTPSSKSTMVSTTAKPGHKSSHKRTLSEDAKDPRPQKIAKLDDLQFDEGFGAGKNDESSYWKRRKISPWALRSKKRRCFADKVKINRSLMPPSARKGLANLTGALCYRSSLIQVLLHQPKLVSWLEKFHQPHQCTAEVPGRCVTCALHQFSKVYWNGSKQELSEAYRRMHDLFRILGWSADVASGQADPDEQAGWLFNQIRAELPTSMSSYFDAIHRSVTSSVIECRKCGHKSSNETHERSFSIPIQPVIRGGAVADYLKQYLIEVIEDYRCEKCGDKGPKTRRHEIGHGPDVLAIHLKRFNWDGRKISRVVPINKILDLNSHRAATNDDNLKYELTGIIKHSGSTGGGHYISVAKGLDGSWNEFDDQRRSTIDLETARGQKGTSFTPYILYYQRIL